MTDDGTERALRRMFVVQLGVVAAILLLALAALVTELDVGTFFFCLLVGALGASIDRLRRVRGGDRQVASGPSRSWVGAAMPVVYGALMASIAYLIFLAEVLTGEGGQGMLTSNLFPNFTKPDTGAGGATIQTFTDVAPVDLTNGAKLLLWAFVAGYSQDFVVGILRRLERTSGVESDHSGSAEA